MTLIVISDAGATQNDIKRSKWGEIRREQSSSHCIETDTSHVCTHYFAVPDSLLLHMTVVISLAFIEPRLVLNFFLNGVGPNRVLISNMGRFVGRNG